MGFSCKLTFRNLFQQVELGERPVIERQAPVSEQEWESYIDSEGQVMNVDALKKRIFSGVSAAAEQRLDLYTAAVTADSGLKPLLPVCSSFHALKMAPFPYTKHTADIARCRHLLNEIALLFI